MKYLNCSFILKTGNTKMQLSTYSIIYLISNFFTVFIIHRFIGLFFSELRCNKTLSYLAYFSYFLVTSTAYLKLDMIITICLNWIIIFVISLTYRSTYQKRVIYTTYILMFMMLPELMIAVLTGYFHFSVFVDGAYSNSIGIIAAKMLTYSEALILRNYKSAKDKQNVSRSLWLSSILIPVATLIYEIMFVSSSDVTKGKAVTSVVILFVINITAFYLYDSLAESYVRQSKLSVLETENKLYNKQCEIMQDSTKYLQALRHDMNNQFITLSQLISAENYSEAEKHLKELSDITQSNIIYSASGNVIIDGLINFKLQNARNDNIKVKTQVAVPKQLNIDTTDLVAVLGNLIDNAITALHDVPPNERTLALKIVFSQKRLIIRISNPYRGDIICNNGKIATSKKEQAIHGCGLNNIAKAVDKYNGYMQTDYSDNIFTVDIIMYI